MNGMPRSNRLTEYNFTFVRVDQIHWLSHRWVVGHQISVFVSCSVGPSGRFSVPQRTRFDIENVSFLLFWFMAIPHVSVVDLKSVQVKVFFFFKNRTNFTGKRDWCFSYTRLPHVLWQKDMNVIYGATDLPHMVPWLQWSGWIFRIYGYSRKTVSRFTDRSTG